MTLSERRVELLGCPFCGGEAGANDFRGTNITPAVSCVRCTADITAPTLSEAITAWNRRALPAPPAPEEVVGVVGELRAIAHHFESTGYAHGQRVGWSRAAKQAADLLTRLSEGKDDIPESPGVDRDPTPATREAELSAAIGPRPHVLVCKGCPAYETENWREPSGDGETYDTGQYAWCNAAGRRSMGAYHYDFHPAPDWCPAPTPASDAGEAAPTGNEP